MLRVVTAALLLTFTLAPAAAAGEPDCAFVTRAPDAPVYAQKTRGHTAIYDVWRETNGVPGLQDTTCATSDGAVVGPDTYVAQVGLDTGGQPICIVRVGCIY